MFSVINVPLTMEILFSAECPHDLDRTTRVTCCSGAQNFIWGFSSCALKSPQEADTEINTVRVHFMAGRNAMIWVLLQSELLFQASDFRMESMFLGMEDLVWKCLCSVAKVGTKAALELLDS